MSDPEKQIHSECQNLITTAINLYTTLFKIIQENLAVAKWTLLETMKNADVPILYLKEPSSLLLPRGDQILEEH